LSDYNQALRMPDDVDSGFWLPPARLIVSASSQDTVRRLLAGWLKICDVTLYQLESLTCTPFRLTVKQWRCLLEQCAGGESSTDPNTRTGQRNIAVQKIFTDSLAKARLSLNMESIASKSPTWRSQALEDIIPDAVVTEVLWELCELNFRLELVSLDSYLDCSKMDKVDRQKLLENCWAG
ncbi:hypothetical protein GYMLUDRAFT_115562, partial [Collybiopsis luxurians FD-317 M1]